ncbi:hypothetical protein JIN85_06640 [Luteolibacter pohnpeiensis]|uniref:UmuC domain-containing protein n=1 Tax=Luteolibacter pohnpeiensis TaxID=454153 RepID=A0A934SA08_9BACT|nr:hypothetical protein [Luteolibacter pohnpeiensis]MBK1882084.1 hypothetical protein [Luteolibacter pohnpeiensis]
MDPSLSALFIDCDSFFASVEQHLDPSLRGKAVGVAPVMAETSCCIAASYEAKAYGVKTGTGIREARILCPGIHIVEAKPAEYVKAHHRVIAAVEDCIHVEAVLSIDEMWAWLPLNWRNPEFVRNLGQQIKSKVANDVSPVIKVSIGAAPNRYLAKLASKMRKPDGLFIIEQNDLPVALHELQLSDLTGVGRSMETRLHAAGIHSVESLCGASKEVLRGVWGGVLGDRLWYLLRGMIMPDLETVRKSIGHSHVLPPESRKPDQAWPILCKLLHKACERLRNHGLVAGSLTIQLGFFGGPRWSPEISFFETDSTLVLMRALHRLWRDRPEPHARLLQVGCVLGKLLDRSNHTPDLFGGTINESCPEDAAKHARLDQAIDRLRAKYGRQCVYMGSVHHSRDKAPMRISFTHIPELGIENDRRDDG